MSPSLEHPSQLQTKIEALLVEIEAIQKEQRREEASLHDDPELAAKRLASFLIQQPDPTLKGIDIRSLRGLRARIDDLIETTTSSEQRQPQPLGAPAHLIFPSKLHTGNLSS